MAQKLLLMPLSVLAMAGCQSSGNQAASFEVNGVSYQADTTSHISRNVYQQEFDSAVLFAKQSSELEALMQGYCEKNNVELDAVKNQWQLTMNSWMALQGQERGPTAALEESWNVQFWPDKKNTTGLKMRQLTQKNKAWTQDEIAQQSVTVQGLGALEWALYDQQSPLIKDKASGCLSSQAIAQNLAMKSASIAEAWQVNPWLALDEMRWESEYIALLTNQLDYSMKKLSRPMAKIGHPRPYFSESWRAQTSMTQLKANVAALEKLYLADGNGLDGLLREKGLNDLADRVADQFTLTLETWPTDSSLFSLLQSKEGYREVLTQYNKLERLKYLIHEEIAIELGVVIGFNATDGD
ncbi:iron-regulated protein A [Vibrio sp. Isolate31]|uniref:imelysin family protein n=1 Tax=unclassified Vibrio TaxID=2614977 RepID=UPI001EFEE2C2|nr:MULTISPECIES: imelysin family protein [unclassified Vibrio]MCG9554428.1 iron-regulated protein A [Vibrio sp. Isolate32]MCG9601249.1 iron-regulated protein A [Vibrio sp. Isolate31]